MNSHTTSLMLYAMLLHFVGDFILQNNAMAIGKSKDNWILARHVSVYSVTVAAGLWPVIGWRAAFTLWTLTYGAHFVTDYFTSRWTSRLWFVGQTCQQEKRTESDGEYSVTRYDWVPQFDGTKRHDFFVAIGFDQLLHAVQLGFTLVLVVK